MTAMMRIAAPIKNHNNGCSFKKARTFDSDIKKVILDFAFEDDEDDGMTFAPTRQLHESTHSILPNYKTKPPNYTPLLARRCGFSLSEIRLVKMGVGNFNAMPPGVSVGPPRPMQEC